MCFGGKENDLNLGGGAGERALGPSRKKRGDTAKKKRGTVGGCGGGLLYGEREKKGE